MISIVSAIECVPDMVHGQGLLIFQFPRGYCILKHENHAYNNMDMQSMQKNYQELFSKCYIENNSIESEVTTPQELEILKELEADEVFDNLKHLLANLLEFKRFVKTNSEYSLLNTLQSHHATVSKLEEDIKKYIKENNEMKACIDEYKNKIPYVESSSSRLSSKATPQDSPVKSKESDGQTVKLETKPTIFISLQKLQKRPNTQKNYRIDRSNTEIYKNKVAHKRITSYDSLAKNTDNKKQTIKSVKFEYFVGNDKNLRKTIYISKSDTR